MITWMQKHNKFLIWTIWVATISFIGTGAVVGINGGGSKAGTVAKVGDIEIKQSKLSMVYSNIYSQYNEMMQGKLDDAQAKEMGLIKQAFTQVETQAKILNFAKEVGVIVADIEVSKKVQTIQGFQKDGLFNKDIYKQYLKNRRLKANVFENTLREELIIQKVLSLLSVDSYPLEKEAVASAMNISDKIAYNVLTYNDVNVSMDDSKIKSFWEMQKENYMTKKIYNLSIIWTQSAQIEVIEDDIKAFYEQNTFNYTDAKGKQLNYLEAKQKATEDLKLKKTKKTAQKAYIAYKKGKREADEKISLPYGDLKLTPAVWQELSGKVVGDILKPKVVADAYATVKIEKITPQKVKSYANAKEEVSRIYASQARKEALLTLAEKTVKTFDINNSIQSDFIQLGPDVNMKSLNSQESLQFIQKLFTSSKEKGMISVTDKIVVYSILEQKVQVADENKTSLISKTVNKLKENSFQSNLIKMLTDTYPTEVYRGGLTN